MTDNKNQQDQLQQETVTSYKSFDANWQCRGYQYKVGESYQHDGPVEACKSGFHACEYPLDVFRYYPPAGSLFAEVEQSGDLSRHNEGSKVASRTISISAKVDIAGLVTAAIKYTMSRCNPVDPESPASATGDQGAASATGYQCAASATGDQGAASATGYQGAASATGAASVAISTGWSGRAQAAEGCAIVLVYRDDDGNITHIRASKVGENGIKPDTWYTLDENGDFKEFT